MLHELLLERVSAAPLDISPNDALDDDRTEQSLLEILVTVDRKPSPT